MICLLYWGINFLKGSDILSRSSHYYAVYDQVNGLQPASAILIKGYKVGSISAMNYDPAQSENVVVEFSIRSKYKIPRNSKARIYTDGIMGGKGIEIIPGDSPDHLHTGDTLFSEIDLSFMDMAGEEFATIKNKVTVLMNSMTATLNSLNAVLVDNKANLDATFGNLAAISGNLNEVVSSEKQSLRGIMTNLDALTASLAAKAGTMDTILGNTARFSDSLSRMQLPTLADELMYSVQTLNATLDKINTGSGSAAMLINDRKLYESLAASSANLSALLEDIRLHPRRYINLSVFGGRDRD